ncbi:hypothetical protein CF386_12020 [Paraphotobacterium marinum]|uniref:Glycosyltransferase 2-like domain-containing protein n=1 Tax=Paraphotobacterium marinum TaxID=1755811 RepID=A0A220VHU8_9GAMM|nr:hypothetical protein [Paraphotobacterium marinum]ASK79762.1 hypothetical protein CF386_12020 [Paraphotobacterium marinum]
MDVVEKYLTKYAEDEVRLLKDLHFNKSYKYQITIPAYKESFDFIARLIESFTDELLILINVNQPDNVENSKEQNNLFKSISQNFSARQSVGNITLFETNSSKPDLLLVDRFTYPIPHKKGVGLARKILADISCWLIKNNIVTSPFIASTDADTILPLNYFNFLSSYDSEETALIYPHEHLQIDNSKISLLTILYEKKLNYYVDGLNYARSRYAYHTIGSMIAFHHKVYCIVRGFPKRSAGEDFYFLNKVNKIKPVLTLKNPKIQILPRKSDRVPFGTGPTIQNLIENKIELTTYDPRIFKYLKEVNLVFNDPRDYKIFESFIKARIPLISYNALKNIGFEKFLGNLNNPTTEQLKTQLFLWFDALKTLKFIHYFQNHGFHQVPVNEACRHLKLL